MKTYKHSGDIGDIIYSLYAVKSLGGGVLYLDVDGGATDHACNINCHGGKTKFGINGYNFLEDLIKSQSYISDLKIWNGESVDFNLNDFRLTFHRENHDKFSLLQRHLAALNIKPISDINSGWLAVDGGIKLDKPIVINRSPRYHSSYTWFVTNKDAIAEHAVFIGHPKEHEIFEYTYEISIPYYKCKDALEVAKIIKGCDLYVGNESAPLAIAIGLGDVDIIQEPYTGSYSCIFDDKKNMIYTPSNPDLKKILHRDLDGFKCKYAHSMLTEETLSSFLYKKQKHLISEMIKPVKKKFRANIKKKLV